jgi:hypothetical protein
VDRLVNLVRLYRGTEDLDALREEFRCVLDCDAQRRDADPCVCDNPEDDPKWTCPVHGDHQAQRAPSSGEATALREAVIGLLDDVERYGWDRIPESRIDEVRALAASPSRPCENEFHGDACDGSRQDCHPVASPSQPEKEGGPRDPEEAPCRECGNEVRHPGTGLLVCECPAPAPSAAPDTGLACGACGGTECCGAVHGRRYCASPGAGGADAKETKP